MISFPPPLSHDSYDRFSCILLHVISFTWWTSESAVTHYWHFWSMLSVCFNEVNIFTVKKKNLQGQIWPGSGARGAWLISGSVRPGIRIKKDPEVGQTDAESEFKWHVYGSIFQPDPEMDQAQCNPASGPNVTQKCLECTSAYNYIVVLHNAVVRFLYNLTSLLFSNIHCLVDKTTVYRPICIIMISLL